MYPSKWSSDFDSPFTPSMLRNCCKGQYSLSPRPCHVRTSRLLQGYASWKPVDRGDLTNTQFHGNIVGEFMWVIINEIQWDIFPQLDNDLDKQSHIFDENVYLFSGIFPCLLGCQQKTGGMCSDFGNSKIQDLGGQHGHGLNPPMSDRLSKRTKRPYHSSRSSISHRHRLIIGCLLGNHSPKKQVQSRCARRFFTAP